MKLLNGAELAGFIKERHARQSRQLAGQGIVPQLAIVQVKDDPVINTYVRLKKEYGSDIGAVVQVYTPDQEVAAELISKLSSDKNVHGIIIQLPLSMPEETEEIVNMVAPAKDVDALGVKAKFEPATPMAILWLLAGYNVDLSGKEILLIGKGRLVGQPLEEIFKKSGHQVTVADRQTKNLAELSRRADVIITATGSPAILKADMVKQEAVVVDAGVASEEGKTVGDLADDIYQRDDLTITPKKGGVGPLTVCALFENVIQAASSA